MAFNAEKIFGGDDRKSHEKSAFLAKVFGIVSEKIVCFWLEGDNAKYENLYERPRLKLKNGSSKAETLDFTVINKETHEVFIVEQKNLFAHKNGKLRTMDDKDGFVKPFEKWVESKKERTRAFEYFMGYSENSAAYEVTSKMGLNAKGAILIWSHCEDKDREKFMIKYGFKDILSMQDIINDLKNNDKYNKWIRERKDWLEDLFSSIDNQ